MTSAKGRYQPDWNPRIGSLCTGYGGLDLGLMDVVGGSLAWHSEIEPAAIEILDEHWPDVPNLGDFTTTDWLTIQPVDWLTAGYPCQPFSAAGKRKGSADDRHIWPFVTRAIGVLRPRAILLENVRGHLTLGFDSVLADLARLGYDATWGVVRAADAGAPHGRARLFVVATDSNHNPAWNGCEGSNAARCGTEPAQHGGVAPDAVSGGRWPEGLQRGLGAAERVQDSPADADRQRSQGSEPEGRRDVPDGCSAAHSESNGWDEGRSEPARFVGRSDAAECGDDIAADPEGDARRSRQHGPEAQRVEGNDEPGWGAYAPAVRRWERVLGRSAPRPTEPGRTGERLSPRFVEWMQGLPPGWVTDVDIPRNAQLKALGNGVVPQQASLAIRTLLALEATA